MEQLALSLKKSGETKMASVYSQGDSPEVWQEEDFLLR